MAKLDNAFNSISNLTVESVATALDWSWLVDFGQGDFAQGKSAAEIVLLNDCNWNNLLVRGIVHQLQGEYNPALSLFSEAFDLAVTIESKLIIATFAYLTEQKAQETFADGFAVSLNLTVSSFWFKRILALINHVSHINLRLQTNFMQQIGKILPYFRTVLARQDNFVQQEQYCQKIQSKLTRELEIYQNAEIYAIAESLYTVLAHLLNLVGKIRPAWELITTLTKAYTDSQKFLQAGWFSLTQGDLLVTIAPWGQPIMFGYCVAKVMTNPQSIRSFDRSILDTAKAHKLYSQAREYFTIAEAPRGEAMAIMKLAYLNGISYQWNLAAFGYMEAKQYFIQTGDTLNAIAAEMGYLWSILQYERLDSDHIGTLTQWMEWIEKQGAISWGMSWGLAFALAAEEALLINQEVEVALNLIKVAEIITTKLATAPLIRTSLSCKKLWQTCILLLENVSQKIVISLALEDNWEQAFYLSEKIKIYGIISLNTNNNHLNLLNSSIPSIKEVSQQLHKGVLLISYLVTNKVLLMWGITRQGLIKTHICLEIEQQFFKIDLLITNLDKWLKTLFDKNVDKQIQNTLEKLLLEPFTEAINQAHYLVIMSCKQLQVIPFAALKFNNTAILEDVPKKYLLGLYKAISYLNFANNINFHNPPQISPNNKVVIITENEAELDNKSSPKLATDFVDLSLMKALILAIINVYDFAETSNNKKELVKTVQLFMSSKTLFLDQSMLQNLVADLAIINISDAYLKQFPTLKLASLTQTILSTGTKTVAIIFQGEFAIATAMLTFFFHQELSRGCSVAQSLYQAQQKVSRIKVPEAMDFCRLLQSYISWETNTDRAIRGLLTKYMGDILVLGGNYVQAGQAYEVAINIFYSTGYVVEARILRENYQLFDFLEDLPENTYKNRPIFQAASNWNNGFIFGDFSLKNTAVKLI